MRLRRRRPSPPPPTTFAEVMAMGGERLRALVSEDPAKAAPLVEAAAKYGLVEVQILWGRMLLHGQGVAEDRKAAFRWFGIAAASDHPEAINMLGRCHELGWGTPPDMAQAVRHYRRAAETGHAWAQHNLAQILLNGTPDNAAVLEALDLHRRAAAQNLSKSMNVIGRFCEEGWHTPRDITAAEGWYRRAAEGGDCWGAFNLARLLLEREEIGNAATWLRRAAQDGHPEFVASMVPALASRPEPELRAIAEEIAGLTPRDLASL